MTALDVRAEPHWSDCDYCQTATHCQWHQRCLRACQPSELQSDKDALLRLCVENLEHARGALGVALTRLAETVPNVGAALAKVRALPSPWRARTRPSGRIDLVCDWCHTTDEYYTDDVMRVPPHPANDCLWFLAHQPPPAEGETRPTIRYPVDDCGGAEDECRQPKDCAWHNRRKIRGEAETPSPEPVYSRAEFEADGSGGQGMSRTPAPEPQPFDGRRWEDLQAEARGASPARATPPLAPLLDKAVTDRSALTL